MTESASPRLDAGHWQAIYEGGEPGWDLGHPAPPFAALVAQPPAWLQPDGRIFHAGAGLGHDAALFAQAGFRITAVDFAPTAVAALHRLAAVHDTLQVLEADLFAIPDDHHGVYDYALEHTCFCAIAPTNRAAWFAAMHRVLRPGGILFGLFYRFEPNDDAGPPFAISEDAFRELAGQHFELLEFAVPGNSLPRRAGRERFVRLRKVAG